MGNLKYQHLKDLGIIGNQKIGFQGSGYKPGDSGNIRGSLYHSEDVFIQERFDFKGKNGEPPHYNLDYGTSLDNPANLTRGLLNTINKSKRFSKEDKDRLKRDLHSYPLFPEDD